MTDVNRKAERSRQLRYRLSVLDALHNNPWDYRHGTNHGYSCGCRCEKCRSAAKERRVTTNAKLQVRKCVEKQRAILSSNPGDSRHGTITGYVYGCRCRECRNAQRVYNRARMELAHA